MLPTVQGPGEGSSDGSVEVGPDGMTVKQRDFYKAFRKKIRKWLQTKGAGFKYADVFLVAPDLFHVLCRLAIDRRIPPLDKAKLGATIAYFVSPVGLIPEGLVGPIGYIDDIALSAYVLNGLLNSEHASVVREHWAGDGDVLSVVQGVLEVLDSAIASGLWRRVKDIRPPSRR